MGQNHKIHLLLQYFNNSIISIFGQSWTFIVFVMINY